jgi:thiol:disulfide interchange protein
VTGKVYPTERVLEVISFEKAAEGEPKAKGATWHRTLPNALAEAQARKTLILVDAYAEWCGWCKKLEQETLASPEVLAKIQEFTLLKIDTDKHPV